MISNLTAESITLSGQSSSNRAESTGPYISLKTSIPGYYDTQTKALDNQLTDY